MRIGIVSATIIAIWACSAAQAQNAPKSCDAECVQRLQQNISDLQQRVSALEQAMETTGTVSGATRPDILLGSLHAQSGNTYTVHISA